MKPTRMQRFWNFVSELPEGFRVLLLAGAFILVLLVPTCAHAETLFATDGTDTVQMFDRPCSNAEVLKRLPPSMHAAYSEALAAVDGQKYPACWRKLGNGYHLLYEDGDQGLIPAAEVRKVQTL